MPELLNYFAFFPYLLKKALFFFFLRDKRGSVEYIYMFSKFYKEKKKSDSLGIYVFYDLSLKIQHIIK